MAAVWLEVDAFPLHRLIEMIDERQRGDSRAALAAEIRHLEDAFGLNPVARRRLNWEIGVAESRRAELHAAADDGGDPRLGVRERLARVGPRTLEERMREVDPRALLVDTTQNDWSTT